MADDLEAFRHQIQHTAESYERMTGIPPTVVAWRGRRYSWPDLALIPGEWA